MRCILLSVLSLAVLLTTAFPLRAEEKPAAQLDAKKLVGKWEGAAVLVVSDGLTSKTSLEFTAEGVIKVKATTGTLTISNEGKYTLNGNKLTIITKIGEKEGKKVSTITKLTDDELVWTSSADKTEAWKRVKETKK